MGLTDDLRAALQSCPSSSLDLSSEHVQLKLQYLDAEINKQILERVAVVLTHHETIQEHLAQGVRDCRQYTRDKIVQAADATDDARGRIEFLEQRLALMERQLLTLAQNVEGTQSSAAENEERHAALMAALQEQIARQNEHQATITVSDSEDEADDAGPPGGEELFLADRVEKVELGNDRPSTAPKDPATRRFTLRDIPLPEEPALQPVRGSFAPAPEEVHEAPTVTEGAAALDSSVLVEQRTVSLSKDGAVDEGAAEAVALALAPPEKAGAAPAAAVADEVEAKGADKGEKTAAPGPVKAEAEAVAEAGAKPAPEEEVEFDVLSPRAAAAGAPPSPTGVRVRVGSASLRRLSKQASDVRSEGAAGDLGAAAAAAAAAAGRSRQGSQVSLGARPGTAPRLSRAGGAALAAAAAEGRSRRNSLEGVQGHPAVSPPHGPRLRRATSTGKARRMSRNPREAWQRGMRQVVAELRQAPGLGALHEKAPEGQSIAERLSVLEDRARGAVDPSDVGGMAEKLALLEQELGQARDRLARAEGELAAGRASVDGLKSTVGKAVADLSFAEQVPALKEELKRVAALEGELKAALAAEAARAEASEAEQAAALERLRADLAAEAARRRRSSAPPPPEPEPEPEEPAPAPPRKSSAAPAAGLTEEEKLQLAADRASLKAVSAAVAELTAFREQQEDWVLARAADLQEKVASASLRGAELAEAVAAVGRDTEKRAQDKDAVHLLGRADFELRAPLRELRGFLADAAALRGEEAALRAFARALEGAGAGAATGEGQVFHPLAQALEAAARAFDELGDKVTLAEAELAAHDAAAAKAGLQFLQLVGAMQSKDAMMRLHAQLMERLDEVAEGLQGCASKEEQGALQKQLEEDIRRISDLVGAQAGAFDKLQGGALGSIERTNMLENRVGELEAQVFTPEGRFRAPSKPSSPLDRSRRPSVDMAMVNQQIQAEVSRMADLMEKKQAALEAGRKGTVEQEELKKIQDELEFTVQKVEGLYATKADISLVDLKASKADLDKKADKAAVRSVEGFLATLGDELARSKLGSEKDLAKLRAQLEAQLARALAEQFENNPQTVAGLAKHNAWLCLSCQRPATAPHHHAGAGGPPPVRNPLGAAPADVLRAGFRMPLAPRDAHASPRDHALLRPLAGGGAAGGKGLRQHPAMSASTGALDRSSAGGAHHHPQAAYRAQQHAHHAHQGQAARYADSLSPGRQLQRGGSWGDPRHHHPGGSAADAAARGGVGGFGRQGSAGGKLSTGRPGTSSGTPGRQRPGNQRKDIAGSWLQVDRIKPGPLFQVDPQNNQKTDDLLSQVDKLNQKMLKEV